MNEIHYISRGRNILPENWPFLKENYLGNIKSKVMQ